MTTPGAAPAGSDDDALDFRGARRLTGAEEWVWYLAAGVSYIVLGIWHKWLLNWFVGPIWLVVVIVVGPWLTDRIGITGRRGNRTYGRAGVGDAAGDVR